MQIQYIPQHLHGGNRRVALLAACLAGSAVLGGCGMGLGNTLSSGPVPVAGVALKGVAFGGQQPVNGATIQLYAAGGSGYASSASPRIGATIKTDANGFFNITSAYTCPSSNAQMYITATGGDAGSGPNANLAMMAALGSCGTLVANAATTYLYINEVTTVGSVWALAPFMSGPTLLGSTSSNFTGLANAFADVNTLVNTGTGAAPGPATPAGATVPLAEINTLANILASCINSSGGLAGSSTNCGNLFSATTPSGGSAPTDTITAAMNIAQHPGYNVHGIYSLAPATAPFQPTLPTQPNDFTIALVLAPTGLSSPSALAADSAGNIWITNSLANTASKLSNIGTLSSTYTGSLNSPSAIAVDTADGVWITNRGNNTLTHLTAAGTAAGGSPYSGGGLNLPSSISLDSAGNAWVGNSGNASASKFSPSGSPISSSSGYTASGITAPVGIAVSPH